ncbi:hypothetical protein J7W08_00450 [Methanococcoides orientis]|uniref:hypothetical protein n=1 Tax=Methanococcoides orientis TaxID=2822137 RepID=UPI001E3D6EDA|nr:hypothetical protein [Methanococcoides orientis]UGV40854.1 hypothetical protein J7W08_00450 [Methanococcoides orientis]
MNSLFKNERAADSLPLRFTIASLLILLIMILFFTAISDLKEKSDENLAIVEIEKLVSNTEQISVRGEGSIIYLEIDIPENVYVHMGELPNEDNLWPSNSKNYYIQIDERHIIYDSISSFSNENMTGAYVITPGHHELKLESERDTSTGMLFIKISEQ